MTQVIISNCEYGLRQDDEGRHDGQEATLRLADPSPDGFREAYNALKKNMSLRVVKNDLDVNLVDEQLEKTVMRAWHILIDIGTGLEGARKDLQPLGHIAPKYIH